MQQALDDEQINAGGESNRVFFVNRHNQILHRFATRHKLTGRSEIT